MPQIQSRSQSSFRPAVTRQSAVSRPAADPWDSFVAENGTQLEQGVASAMYRLGWLPHDADVQDLTQEVYCRLLTSPRQLAAIATVPRGRRWAYLHRIARTVVIDELRMRRAQKRGGPQGERVELRESLPAAGASAEDRLLARERTRLVGRLVRAQQGPEQGERNLRILALAAVEGYTSGEISRQLGGTLSPSSVHSILCRLRQQLAGAARATGSPVVSSAVAAAG